jgi:hypothetical protein
VIGITATGGAVNTGMGRKVGEKTGRRAMEKKAMERTTARKVGGRVMERTMERTMTGPSGEKEEEPAGMWTGFLKMGSKGNLKTHIVLGLVIGIPKGNTVTSGIPC